MARRGDGENETDLLTKGDFEVDKTEGMDAMKTVEKKQLVANLSTWLELVELEGEEILVTDGSQPVIKISPYKKSVKTSELFKDMRGKVKYFEDLTNPTTEEWTEI